MARDDTKDKGMAVSKGLRTLQGLISYIEKSDV